MKHIYEIAKIKSGDSRWELVDLETVCKSIIEEAHKCGIEVVRHLDPEEYREFLEERREVVEAQEQAIIEAKQAKLLRLN